MAKKRIVADIHARLGSSRLPGKVLMDICGKPVLGHIVERLRRSKHIDDIVVATSVNPENDAIEAFCRADGVHCFRGSEDDVLGRVVGALNAHHADVAVEVFGDEPLIDTGIIDQLIEFYLAHDGQYDFVGNDLKTTYPPGVDVEVVSAAALRDSANRVQDMAVREHCTLFIRQHPEIYRLYNMEAPPELHYPEMEIELDSPEDLDVVKAVYQHFYATKPDFDIHDVVRFMNENPDIMDKNRHIHRRWKEHRGE